MKEQKEWKAFLRPVVLTAVLCIGFAAGMGGSNAAAEEAGDTADDTAYTPAFANPAQAQHAANIAEAAAAEPDAETLDALSAVEEAEAALKDAEETGNEQAIEDARKQLAEAEEAYAEVIEARIGVITSEIEAMRNADMGWGEIARELGVHPSVLGLGHTKAYRNKYGWSDDEAAGDEVAEATERNTRTGWSQGHGLGLNAGVKDTAKAQGGYALGRVNKDDKTKNAGGISGAAGLSGGGQGNAGGQGKGNSGGSKAGGVGSDGGPGKSDKGGSQGGGSGKSKSNSGGKGNSGGGKGNSGK
ncbi:MAG: helix-turn-helix domain-containing protein [Desulfobulbaceae bacterium]|jgi:hypothetical protein|nr:helix-turn-helix domain-containing protein [Desulfobulbaceae bacterium]